jgi:hypothetical protein
MESHSVNTDDLNIQGKKVNKHKIIYFSQVIALYIVILSSIVNLSLQHPLTELWVTLLSSSISVLLPAPSYRTQAKDRTDNG